jgi:hypothetical protein
MTNRASWAWTLIMVFAAPILVSVVFALFDIAYPTGIEMPLGAFAGLAVRLATRPKEQRPSIG